MKYAEIKYCDIANGVGCRTTLFVSGCTHRCPGCFNEIAWDFNYGNEFDQAAIDAILSSLEPPYITGLSILGGEPMEPQNQEALVELVEAVRARFPEKSIWCYTGDVLEDLLDENSCRHTPYTARLLACIDVLVDGPWMQELYDISLRFRGSSNQRLIDLPATLNSGELVLWQDKALYSTHSWES